jgi:hypothetical protein
MANGEHASLHDTMLDMLSDAEGSQNEGHRGKLLRAVKRTEATVGRKEWNFFDRQAELKRTAIEVRPAFPKTEAAGVWAFLAPEKQRSEIFEDGLPYNVQCRMQNLPDEIFLWVLGEAPREKSRKLRDEYMRLLGACSDQIERLLDDEAVLELFRDLGASERALGASPQPGRNLDQGGPYPEHDKIRLQNVLRILAGAAHALGIQALTRTMSILLRLGIDNIVREDQAVATDYQDALLQVAQAVPARSWNNFVRSPLPLGSLLSANTSTPLSAETSAAPSTPTPKTRLSAGMPSHPFRCWTQSWSSCAGGWRWSLSLTTRAAPSRRPSTPSASGPSLTG